LEKQSILHARELQRNFLAFFSKSDLNYRKDPGDKQDTEGGDGILSSPAAHKHQEIEKFKHIARGIMYYKTLSHYVITYVLLPMLMVIIIPVEWHPSEILPFIFEIFMEIFFAGFLLWVIFKAVHDTNIKKKAQLILGVHIKTYEEHYRQHRYDDFDF